MPDPLIPTAIAQAASAVTGDKAAKKKAARARFENAWARIRDELVAHLASEGMPKDALEWFERNLEYNTPGGKLNRGMSVVDTLAVLKRSELTDTEYFRAAVLGWCVELLQAFFLVSDDMMDQSITRRGQPCWYRVDGVGHIAINDSFLLEGAIYHLLKTHFRGEKYYVDLLELFHGVSYKTEMGQLVDLVSSPEHIIDLNRFSLEKHRMIVIYKTAYYSFYLPVALAMLTHGIPAPSGADLSLPLSAPPPTPASLTNTADSYALALAILIPLGEYFQVQDDVLDYSGTPEQIGKVGTDIIDNKCSWPVNTALKLATPEQRALLDANYGRKDAQSEARVKELYRELGILQRYEAYEEEAVGRIRALIDTIPAQGRPDGLKRAVFNDFVDKIYKRSK